MLVKLALLSLPAAPSTLQNSPTSLPLHYPLVVLLAMLAVFSFLCSIYDAIKVQFLVLEHFSNILQHVLCYYPPRPVWRGSGPASGPPSRATHCPSTHRYPPHLCIVLRGLPFPALPCRTISLNLFHLTWSHFPRLCSHSRSSTLEQCSCWHFEQ